MNIPGEYFVTILQQNREAELAVAAERARVAAERAGDSPAPRFLRPFSPGLSRRGRRARRIA